ncbi:hypothetical protein LTR53_013121 [Teratosphaeriaceae sp. CCFEE 6253]|nr:hypothetical protein LTR53_013121 [Teratosphaeriaceae sp. CCFEE 6253]
MSQLQYYAYDGYGKEAEEHYHYSQAVRIPPNRVECSGQGGWDPATNAISPDLATEIAQAFANCDLTLKTAGVQKGLQQAYSVKSYHVGAIDAVVIETMVAQLRRWMPEHRPIWTMIGVPTLALPGMRVEIDVVAFDEEEK